MLIYMYRDKIIDILTPPPLTLYSIILAFSYLYKY